MSPKYLPLLLEYLSTKIQLVNMFCLKWTVQRDSRSLVWAGIINEGVDHAISVYARISSGIQHALKPIRLTHASG